MESNGPGMPILSWDDGKSFTKRAVAVLDWEFHMGHAHQGCSGALLSCCTGCNRNRSTDSWFSHQAQRWKTNSSWRFAKSTPEDTLIWNGNAPSLPSFWNVPINRQVLIIWNSLQKYLGKGEKTKEVPRTCYTQTLILQPSPWKFWPGSPQSLGNARMHKSEPAGIKVSCSSRNQDQYSLSANMAKSPGSAVLPKPSVLWELRAQRELSTVPHTAILSGLPGALTASLENSIHPFPAGKFLLCISALSCLQSRHQAGCWKRFCKKRILPKDLQLWNPFPVLYLSSCSFSLEDPQWV